MMDYIHFNFFSVGSLIPVLFNFFVAAYLLSIPRRLTATTHLGIAFLYLTIFNFAYFVMSSLYHPAAAYHRWVTVGVIMLAETHFNTFWFYFPEPKKTSLARAMLAGQYIVSIIISAVFFYATFNGPRVFHFDGHYWDFTADRLSKIIGIIIMFYLVVFIGLALWRLAGVQKRQRWVVLALTCTFILATAVPSITNTLSREGMMDRQVFQITWDIFTIFGYFFMAIVYINSSRDRTTIIAKIVGITLVTFLVLMQGLAFVFFNDKEKSYDTIKMGDMALFLGGRAHDPSIAYSLSYDIASGGMDARFMNEGDSFDYRPLDVEMRNTAMYEKIKSLPDDRFEEEAALLISRGGRYFAGYGAFIRHVLKGLDADDKRKSDGLLSRLRLLNRELFYSRKIALASMNGTVLASIRYEAGKDPAMAAFMEAVERSMKESGIEAGMSVQELLKYLAPLRGEANRIYRRSADDSLHYVAYQSYDAAADRVMEVGFFYRDYRIYLHSFAFTLIVIFVSVVIFIRFGFQMFLSGVLINPIRQLLAGIKNLNQGNLDFIVPVKVEDEIGTLAKTFNGMVSSLRLAKMERELAERAYRDAESRFRGLVEQSLVGIYIISQDRFAYVNPKFSEIFGYTRDELLNMESLLQIIAPGDHDRIAANIKKRERNEAMGLINRYRGIRKDGAEIDIEIYGSRMMIDGVPAVIGTVLEITERIKAEEDRDRMRSFLKNIIDSMPSVLISVDREGNVLHWNSQAEKIVGITESQALGRPLEELFPLLGLLKKDIERAIEKTRPQKVEKLEHRQDEETRYSDILIYPLEANGVQGAVIRIDDVTARVRLEEMMVQTEKMMSVGGLAAGMAHEINNPLSGILMSALNLKRRLSPEIAKNEEAAGEAGTTLGAINRYMELRGLTKMIDAIEEMGNRASRIVANMLNFSRRSESNMEPRDVASVVDKAVELARHDYDLKKKYDFRHVDIVKDYEPGLPPVYCVETEIEQVLLNLLKNAAHAMSEKKYIEGLPQIRLSVKKDGDMARITIADNGPGIEKKNMGHIFDPFFTTKKAGVGTGLGLSVSYHIIVNNHHGQMTAQGDPGKGATFIIKLPLAK